MKKYMLVGKRRERVDGTLWRTCGWKIIGFHDSRIEAVAERRYLEDGTEWEVYDGFKIVKVELEE